MQVSFLLDENIAAPLADKLDKAGHDVNRLGVKWFETRSVSSSRKTPSSVRPRSFCLPAV